MHEPKPKTPEGEKPIIDPEPPPDPPPKILPDPVPDRLPRKSRHEGDEDDLIIISREETAEEARDARRQARALFIGYDSVSVRRPMGRLEVSRIQEEMHRMHGYHKTLVYPTPAKREHVRVGAETFRPPSATRDVFWVGRRYYFNRAKAERVAKADGLSVRPGKGPDFRRK